MGVSGASKYWTRAGAAGDTNPIVSDTMDFEPYVAMRRLETSPTYDLYEARHQSLDRVVWLEVLRPNVPLSSPFAARLEREGQILARLSHPNVISILDCVKRPPRLWLVLEAIDGWTLAEILAQLRRTRPGRGLEARGAVALVLQVARGLAHAHERGIVHRAIHPKHVVVSKDGHCKLAGFVAAREAGSDGDELNPDALEPAYLSPEQVLGEMSDERGDLFSLGVVLYELLAGRPPFSAARDSHTAQSIRHQTPDPLGARQPDVSPELERIVQRCLEKSRERRFESVAPLIRALEHVLGPLALAELAPMVARALGAAGLAVPSAAPGPRTRADELRRREAGRGLRQSIAIAAVISGLTLLGGAGIYVWLDRGRLPVEPASTVPGGPERTELIVVADPWAHVFVDGQHRETTPFATPISLHPGVRHVRLEHPHAPPERRRLTLAPSERIVLEVVMRVQTPRGDAGVHPALRAPDAGRRTP